MRQLVRGDSAQIGQAHHAAHGQDQGENESEGEHAQASLDALVALGAFATQRRALVQFFVTVGARLTASFFLCLGQACDDLVAGNGAGGAQAPTQGDVGPRGQVTLRVPVVFAAVPKEGGIGLVVMRVFPVGGDLLARLGGDILGREPAERRGGQRGRAHRGGGLRASLRVGGGGGGHDRRGVLILGRRPDDRGGLGNR